MSLQMFFDLVFFLPQVFMVFALWLHFLKRVSSIRPFLEWVTNSLVPARKTQRALNSPSSGKQYSDTFACVPSPFSMIIILVIFFFNAGILPTCFCTEKFCIWRVSFFFCLPSGKTMIICDTWAVLFIYTVGISNNKGNMKLLLVQQSLSSAWWQLVEGWHPATLNALLDSQEQRQTHNME